MAFSAGSYSRRTRGIQHDAVGKKVKLSGSTAVDTSGTSQFSGTADNDFGSIVGGSASDTEDLGLITGGAADTEIDLGDGFGEDIIADTLALPQFTVSGVTAASTSNKGQIVYISDETGGATLAFSDGTNWRRLQDRAVIS